MNLHWGLQAQDNHHGLSDTDVLGFRVHFSQNFAFKLCATSFERVVQAGPVICRALPLRTQYWEPVHTDFSSLLEQKNASSIYSDTKKSHPQTICITQLPTTRRKAENRFASYRETAGSQYLTDTPSEPFLFTLCITMSMHCQYTT